jgi:hypothetical protein
VEKGGSVSKFKKRLLKYKATILTLVVALLAFVGLYLSDQFGNNLSGISKIIESIALAFLTSGVVSFIFEYMTEKEFSDVVQEVVREEIANSQKNCEKVGPENEELYNFWKPFLQEDSVIVLSEDRSGTEPTVRATDLETALLLYQKLMDFYSVQGQTKKVKIDFVSKNRQIFGTLPFSSNLIVIAAPGANPVATTIMNKLKSLHQPDQAIQNGYVFVVEKENPSYLENAYILSDSADKTGIRDIQKGKIVDYFPRDISDKADATCLDCCLIVRGEILEEKGQTRQVLIIGGHSRYATRDGVQYILSNNDWAKQVNHHSSKNTESILEISGSISQGRKATLRKPPRPIQKAIR